ncbi:NrdH-redoxin [candidate division KSB1 bacterium]|nr:MAG: NrdH-redoxin [candidate division KSB1 bacterium]
MNTQAQPRVIVFTGPSCPWCTEVKRYLRRNRIRFREVDVSRDANGARDLARRGYKGVPVVFINNRPVVGFNKAEIDRLLNIKGERR